MTYLDKLAEPGAVVRAEHPRYGWGYYALNRRKNKPNFRRPVKWVDDAPTDPTDPSGHFEKVGNGWLLR